MHVFWHIIVCMLFGILLYAFFGILLNAFFGILLNAFFGILLNAFFLTSSVIVIGLEEAILPNRRFFLK